MTPDQRLGARIKQLRKDAGLTQERMGKILKLDQAAICRIESGKQKITAVQLHVLAVGFNVLIDAFFERDVKNVPILERAKRAEGVRG
jgi:transcriptional regulator with XRE-family HTH domain